MSRQLIVLFKFLRILNVVSKQLFMVFNDIEGTPNVLQRWAQNGTIEPAIDASIAQKNWGILSLDEDRQPNHRLVHWHGDF